MFVQILLNDSRIRNGMSPITVDGIIGPETLGEIDLFQRQFTAFRDDRMDPGGPTITALEAAHLDGILSGEFADFIRRYPNIRVDRNLETTQQIFQAYLKTLREKLD